MAKESTPLLISWMADEVGFNTVAASLLFNSSVVISNVVFLNVTFVLS